MVGQELIRQAEQTAAATLFALALPFKFSVMAHVSPAHAATVDSYPTFSSACWIRFTVSVDPSYSTVIVRAFASPLRLLIPCSRPTAMRIVVTQPSQVMPGTFNRSVSIVSPFVSHAPKW